MKEIDLLIKIANREIKPGFKIKSKNGDIYEYIEGKDHFVNVKDKMYIKTLGHFTKLNDEIEIIEEDKKIEYCKGYECFDGIDDYIEHLRDKIDDLIDEVNILKE